MKINKYIIMIVLVAAALLLVACVSEEGARKHAARGAAMPAGIISGMEWQAMIYDTRGGKDMMIGRFKSRSECNQAVAEHMGKQRGRKKGHLASACAVMARN